MKTRDDFIANNSPIEDIREEIAADSLGYISIEGLKESIGMNELCLGCLTGTYPDGYIVASESAAIDTVSGKVIRDICL